MRPSITVTEVPEAVSVGRVGEVALRVTSSSNVEVQSPVAVQESKTVKGVEGDRPQATVWASSLNLINNVVGAGLFSMPWAVRRASVVGGAVMFIVIALVNSACYYLLAQCCELSSTYTYLGIGKKAFGERFGIIAQVCVLLYSLGSCVSFVTLVGDFLGGETGIFRTERTVVIYTVSLFVFLPLSLLRNTEGLKWTSLLSFLACFGAAVLIIYTAINRPDEAYPSLEIKEQSFGTVAYLKPVTSSTWAAVPVINVAFTAHYNAPRFYQELKQRSLNRFTLVIAFSMIFSLSVYVCVGICGYLTFGEYTRGSILLNFSPDWYIAIYARGLLALVVAFTFPLAHHSARESVLCLSSSGEVNTNNAPNAVFYLTTLALVLATTLVGATFDKIEHVLAYKGALFGTCVVYIFPPIMYGQLARSAKNEEGGRSSPRALHLKALIGQMGGTALIPVWGLVTCFLSLHSIMSSH